jgi:hypothetical protein
MTTKETKTFDSVSFFRAVKEKMAKMMEGITLAQKKISCDKSEKAKLKLPKTINRTQHFINVMSER